MKALVGNVDELVSLKKVDVLLEQLHLILELLFLDALGNRVSDNAQTLELVVQVVPVLLEALENCIALFI